MRSIWKTYRHRYYFGYGWLDDTHEKNPWWPFDNAGLFQYVVLFALALILTAILMFASEVGAWLITNLFALFGWTLGSIPAWMAGLR